MGFLNGIFGNTAPDGGNVTLTTAAQKYGSLVTTNTFAGSGVYINQAVLSNHSVSTLGVQQPYQSLTPTGTTVSVYILDAKGQATAIEIDTAVFHLVQQINQVHQYRAAQQHGFGYIPGGAVNVPVQMVENDFSMDELEQAETLLEELNGRSEAREPAENASV